MNETTNPAPSAKPSSRIPVDPRRAFFSDRGTSIRALERARGAQGAGMRHNLDKHGQYAKGPGSVGRNDPCPCGSGKKSKKCHPGGLGPSPGLCQFTDPPHEAQGTIRLKSKEQGDLDICRKHLMEVMDAQAKQTGAEQLAAPVPSGSEPLPQPPDAAPAFVEGADA